MIPASQIVQVNPGVITGGGSSLALNGLFLTADTAVPIGEVYSYASADAVGAFFGLSSDEKAMADVYFGGRNNKTVTPATLHFAQYNAAAVAAYLRGGVVSGLSLVELKALSGSLTITVDGGAPETAAAIDLAAATSFSNAATIIEAGFTTPTFSVSYDSTRGAFVFLSDTTGATSTITVATGTLAAGLKLTTATGAVLSQGAAASTPAVTMAAVTSKTLNWATFSTIFEPVDADKLLFSDWVNGQNNRFAYVLWETAAAAIAADDTTTPYSTIRAAGNSGTIPVFYDKLHAAFIMGTAASMNFARTNGRITFAFKYLAGLTASVTDTTEAANLEANGYNFIGEYATANDGFTFFYPGVISGDFGFIDSYLNQVYLNSQFQLALMTLLTSANSIPYTAAGRALINAACADPINEALNFGSIRAGVALSAAQAALVNDAAGTPIDSVLTNRGWYLQVLDATAQVRALRGSPPMSFWYTDGGSVHKITLASIAII